MAKTRIKIPTKLQLLVLYKSAKSCAVCKNSTALHLHHIDGNPSNNIEENIIVLCNTCHDEAHTKHDLSQNLDATKLIGFKNKWEEEVKQRSMTAMTSSSKSQTNWTYFNLSHLPKYFSSFGLDYQDDRFIYLISKKIINENLEPIISPSSSDHEFYSTIFKGLHITDAHQLKYFYEDLTNQLIHKINPFELNSIWSKTAIRKLLKPGDFIYFMNGVYFKSFSNNGKLETRKIHMKSKKIRVEGYVYTQYMFGDSSLHDSFKAHKTVSGLYLVKDISDHLKVLTIHVTPLALGTGTWEYEELSPHVLRKKEWW